MILRLLLGLFIAVGFGGCDLSGSCSGANCVKGSGKVISQDRSVGDFSGIRLNSIGNLSVERTGANTVTVETDDNLQTLVTATVKDGTLVLAESGCRNCSPTKIAFRVTVKDLKEIDLPSVGSAEVTKLDGPTLASVLSGTGSLKLSGRVDDLKITARGTGSCNADDLAAKIAEVDITGVGTVRVNASDTLNAKVSGVGKILYAGSPKLTQSVSGVGSIHHE